MVLAMWSSGVAGDVVQHQHEKREVGGGTVWCASGFMTGMSDASSFVLVYSGFCFLVIASATTLNAEEGLRGFNELLLAINKMCWLGKKKMVSEPKWKTLYPTDELLKVKSV